MTKPTGRPRGRPKTREYVTLMARMDVTLADRVRRYAAAHRQPISVVLRDAVTLLMEEYPAGADPAGSHRLAAHEFLSDRYESPLDTLLGETDSADLDALLSDTNEEVVEVLLAGETRGPNIMADTKEDMPAITSDSNTDSPTPHARPSGSTRSRKVSDGKEAGAPLVSDTKAVADNLSDTKAGRAPRERRKGGRPSSPMRQGILTLLAVHPEGLSAEQIRGYLSPEKPIGDTLQGMRKAGVVRIEGSGKDIRYFCG